MERGTRVTVRAYKGELLERRVWEDTGVGVLLCSEEGYQTAIQTGEEPQCAGFPKSDVLETHLDEDARQ